MFPQKYTKSQIFLPPFHDNGLEKGAIELAMNFLQNSS
jgi:hypothetical protein